MKKKVQTIRKNIKTQKHTTQQKKKQKKTEIEIFRA